MQLTIHELAKQTGYTPGTIRVYINNGVIPAAKRGRDWFIDESQVEILLARRAAYKDRRTGKVKDLFTGAYPKRDGGLDV